LVGNNVDDTVATGPSVEATTGLGVAFSPPLVSNGMGD
jgi:hypothetical protein